MKSFICASIACCVLLAAAGSEAAPIRFQHGPMAVSFDENTGNLIQIECRGQALCRNSAGAPPVTFGIGPTNKTLWFEQLGLMRKLIKTASPGPDRLELTVSAGPYEIIERYRLYQDTARLDRSAQLVIRGNETQKLRGFSFRMPGIITSPNGFYRFPATWPGATHRFADMQPGKKFRGHGSIAPAVSELSPAQSLLWASFTEDQPGVEFTEEKDRVEVRQSVSACGYLRPNQPQEMGFVTLQVVDGNYWNALETMWSWMDSAGLRVPLDQPAWVREGILYSFHPGGTIGSNFKDLGGFSSATEQLLPTLPRLGVNMVWILPVEYKSPYWPLDYYRFADGLGSESEYRKLVAKAHELNLHVWQDLVPHGGAPQAVHNQAHPEFMLQREDGSHLDYWLNDFALPSWQKYMAGVARFYMTNYGLDGFRVDACGGSKEPNWNPNIPYDRASHGMLRGGLEMMEGIRSEVRQASPQSGSILAEVESTRQIAVSDARYDFPFCYTLCRSWMKMNAAAFASALQDYLEEQKLTEPRGTVRLRHVESHDSLRSQGWYGITGMRAMYALSAWIDGIPMIYHGMEDGNAFALAEINRLRRERPELSGGEAFYRAVTCDTPGVFTCLRKKDGHSSVVIINFNREPVKATLSWPGASATVALQPLEYTLWPKPSAPSIVVASNPVKRLPNMTLPHSMPLENTTEWFVDAIEGRLHDSFASQRTLHPGSGSSIYWRPQGTGTLWQHDTTPLHPVHPRLGFKAGKTWRVYELPPGFTNNVRLVFATPDSTIPCLMGAEGLTAVASETETLPPAPDVTSGVELAGVRLRCAGPEYIVSNSHLSVSLLRQGGVIHQWQSGTNTLLEGQDFYGDQEYFSTSRDSRMEASSDVECSTKIWAAPDGLHLRFEGQIRGDDRFALKRPPLWYRNEYVFNSTSGFTQRWAFRTEKDFRNRKAFLSFFASRISVDEYRFERGEKVIAEGTSDNSSNRSGLAQSVPDQLQFKARNQPAWGLAGLKTPSGTEARCFLQGHKLFMTLLDGSNASMNANRWYEFECEWKGRF